MKKEINQHRKQFLALLLMAVMGVFVGCAKDPEDTPAPETKSALAVNVIDVGYNSIDGFLHGIYTRDFVNGDKIGLYVVKSGTILSNNVCLTYNGTAWTGDALMSVAGAKYFAYYPYQETLSGAPVASATDAGAFFTEIIKAWTPTTDQSNLATYSASDLMVGSGNIGERVGNTYKLGFSMNHALSLVIIEMPSTKYTLASDSKYTWTTGAATANFTDFKPYLSSNGTYRYLVKASQYDTMLSGSYQDTYGQIIEKTWDVNIAAGHFVHNKVDGGIKAAKTHILQSGDFYMNDGSLISKGSTLTADQQASCIGIVFQTDITRIGSGEKAALADKGITAHGLVMALTWANGGSNYQWGPAINEPVDPFTPTDKIKLAYRDIDGYNKTKFITAKIINGDKTYGAFNAAFTYGHGESAKYAAPASSTGWFLPSIGQCWDIFVNLGDLSILNEYRDSEIDSSVGLDAPRDINLAINKINSMLQKVSDANTFGSSQTLHSSSQVSSTHTIIWSGYYYYDKLIKSTTKTSNGLIRTTLAF